MEWVLAFWLRCDLPNDCWQPVPLLSWLPVGESPFTTGLLGASISLLCTWEKLLCGQNTQAGVRLFEKLTALQIRAPVHCRRESPLS